MDSSWYGILPEPLAGGLCLEASLTSCDFDFDTVLFGFVVELVLVDLVTEVDIARSPACEILNGPIEDLSMS